MEYRDLYDGNRVLTGKVIEKDEPIPEGCYINIVAVFIEDSEGNVLLQKRSERKGGLWAVTGGHSKTGESSLDGICSEIEEELGLKTQREELYLFKTLQTEDAFVDYYYLKKNISLSEITMQEDEVQDVGWFTKLQVKQMIDKGEFFDDQIEAFGFFTDFKNKNGK